MTKLHDFIEMQRHILWRVTWLPEDTSAIGESQMSYIVADSIQQAADAVSVNVHDIVSVVRMGNVYIHAAR